MNDTRQLEALRDAWLREIPTPTLEAALDRAIAALRADDAEAEEPDAAASKDHSIASAEQAQQPAPADVPECPFLPLQLVPVTDRSIADLIGWGTATRAVCVRIAQERDDAREVARAANDAVTAANADANKAEADLDEARRELEAAQALHADVILRYGPFDKDIEALAKRLYVESSQQRARANKAEAELAALKGQEPIRWLCPCQHANGMFSSVCTGCGGREGRTISLYAAPVPPTDTIPLAQHEAAVAQARREAFFKAELIVRKEAALELTRTADAIRALPDAGGEGE